MFQARKIVQHLRPGKDCSLRLAADWWSPLKQTKPLAAAVHLGRQWVGRGQERSDVRSQRVGDLKAPLEEGVANERN